MDVLYIPQLDEIGTGGEGGGGGGESGGGTAARYRLLRRIPEENAPESEAWREGSSEAQNGEAGPKAPRTVMLTDRAVTRIDVADSAPLKLIVPPEAKGTARDFFVRLVITSDEVPEVTFAAPTGETISFEDTDDGVFKCEMGVNVYAFTEIEMGIFIVNRKQIDIDMEVEFDPCGGALDSKRISYKLGAQYSKLPRPTMAGYTFVGWFTEAEDGVKVEVTDRCKTGVTKLYAHWEVYIDPFVDSICEAGNLTFFSESSMPWFVDGDGAARSGPIDDGGATTLSTVVQGKGTLSFRWRTSSEGDYDWLRLRIDGSDLAGISGDRGWEDFSHTFDADGSHTIEWTYSKDDSVSEGEDCGWIDDVVWTPAEG